MVSAEEAGKDVCANCGIAGVDDIKLEECDGCDLVKYCSEKCKEDNREEHEEECKKRAKELHDRQLFTQPEGTHRGECPICFLPMPLQKEKSIFASCCGQMICCGCCYAHIVSSIHDIVKASRCVFCRTSVLDKEEYKKRVMERIEANDPPSLSNKGTKCYLEGDHDKALKCWTKAAELGDAEAHFKLGKMYMEGEDVDKDEKRGAYHWEKAAIGGHPYARHNLACYEAKNNGNMAKAARHFIIAANLGYDKSMKSLLLSYKNGYITKEEYGATLRTHQAAVGATKSAQRDAAEKD
jgi:tetratricopeptide (TPR) repeat protein